MVGVGAAVVAMATGGAIGVTALAGQVSAAPAPAHGEVRLAADADQAKKGGWLGVMMAPLNDRLAQRLGLSQTTGVVVMGVHKLEVGRKVRTTLRPT